MAAPLLRLDKVEVAYHGVSTAIQGVSLEVRESQIVVLLGANGAGKTTTLRAVSGFLGLDHARVTDGRIEFAGRDITSLSPSRTTQLGAVLVPESDKIFDTMTVDENLLLCLGGRGGKGGGIGMEAIYTYFPALKKLRRRVAGYLSGGERQMLTMSAALLCQPRLLLVDELSLGLAPLVIKELLRVLADIRRDQGLTVLLVEQNARAALEIADYGYVLENGRVAYAGEPDQMLGNDEIREFYLGTGDRRSRQSYRDVKQYRRVKRIYG